MNDQRPDPKSGRPAGIDAMPTEAPRRSASLVLREDNVREQRAASMEAANRSLTDALRFTYRILQMLMIVLAGLFLFSGFQQVNEGETGLRVEFGKLKGGALSSGFHFSLPYPMGRMDIVDTRQKSLEIDETFWPKVRDKSKGIEQLGMGGPSLKPGEDGSLITGDGNIVHTQWSVLYRRDRPVEFATNLNEDAEDPLVRAVVERAVIQTVAEMTIDELLKPGTTNRGTSSVESRVRRLAQDALDELNVGIRLDETVLRHKSPPPRVRSEFELVDRAVEAADKAISGAKSDRGVQLTSLAGTAFEPLLDLINEMEEAIALGNDTRADELLDEIRKVFDGEYDSAQPVEIAGRAYANLLFSGELSRMISSANQQRSIKIAQAKSEAERFRAQLSQYRANPQVFLFTELAEAWRSMLTSDSVSLFWIPTDTQTLVWKITLDPDHARTLERTRNQRELLRSNEQRKKTIEQLKYNNS